MADPIYLIRTGSKAIKLEAREYDSEDELQRILAEYPELLAGEQIDRAEPRRWLLVGREIGIADCEDGENRWSLDHLFVDQDGVPTLVEVKRQSDSRLRREVVGQVLDYAAHARFWTSSFLAACFEETCRRTGDLPAERLKAFLADTGLPAESFWEKVRERLRTGDMRLVFFADAVPPELQRVVEFLNEGMARTEVLAIEVVRYQGEGFTTHVPRVIGVTSEAMEAKVTSRSPSRQWDEPSFFEAAKALPAAAQAALRSLLDAAKAAGLEIRWGKGAQNGSFNVVLPEPCGRAMFTVLTNGKLWLNIIWMTDSPQAERAQAYLRDIAVALEVSPQYMKQPAIDAVAWVPHLGRILEALAGTAAIGPGGSA